MAYIYLDGSDSFICFNLFFYQNSNFLLILRCYLCGVNFNLPMEKERNLNSANCSGVKGNLVDKLSLKVLSERHNALARYIGIPCVVEADAVLKGAAMTDGTIGQVKGYACYCVDIDHFNGDFNRIRFRATGDGKNVAFGFLVDKVGKVEYVAKADGRQLGRVSMPLTPNTKTLYATMPTKKGKPAWNNIQVELLCDGIIGNINEALNCLLGKVQSLESRFERLAAAKTPGVNVCVC